MHGWPSHMSLTSVYLAEEVLALPAEQRRMLAKLLDSVQEDGRTDDEIRNVLRARLDDLKSGRDPSMSFEEVFGEKL